MGAPVMARTAALPRRMPARTDLERWALAPSSASLAKRTAADLLRLALLARLATQLDDPRLARRAARDAQAAAHLLAGLDWPARPGLDDGPDDDPALPSVGVLLEQVHGVPVEVDDLAVLG